MHALETEFRRLTEEALRLATARESLEVATEFLQNIGSPVSSIYSSGYRSHLNIKFEERVFKSFNDGELAEALALLVDETGSDPDTVTTEDKPEFRTRVFRWEGQVENVSLEFSFCALLSEEGTCQIIVERMETVTREHWVTETFEVPVLRFVCPEE